jgi:hypothetical protein
MILLSFCSQSLCPTKANINISIEPSPHKLFLLIPCWHMSQNKAGVKYQYFIRMMLLVNNVSVATKPPPTHNMHHDLTP